VTDTGGELALEKTKQATTSPSTSTNPNATDIEQVTNLYPEQLLPHQYRYREGWTRRQHAAKADSFARKDLGGGDSRQPCWIGKAVPWGVGRVSKKYRYKNAASSTIKHNMGPLHRGLGALHHNIVIGRKRKAEEVEAVLDVDNPVKARK
jgi:hypothetical protein